MNSNIHPVTDISPPCLMNKLRDRRDWRNNCRISKPLDSDSVFSLGRRELGLRFRRGMGMIEIDFTKKRFIEIFARFLNPKSATALVSKSRF
jgi:hypothetical protein